MIDPRFLCHMATLIMVAILFLIMIIKGKD